MKRVALFCDRHGLQPLPEGQRNRTTCPICEQQMVARVRDGEYMQAIADEYGLTRERIRQLVTAVDPQAPALGRAIRAEQARVAQEVRRQVRIAKRTRGLPPCVICWGPIQRIPVGNLAVRKHYTCSQECARLWLLTRLHLDPAYHEQHDLLMARRRIELGVHGQIVHAVNLLTGTAKRYSNRHYPYAPKIVAALTEVERLREGKTPPPDALPVPQRTQTIAHGTATGYSQGCREECCRAANREASRRRRARQRAEEVAS